MADLKSFSDDELFRRFKTEGDPVFIGELFKRYKSLLYFAVCLKYLKNQEESKDALSEIFLKLLSDPKKHRVDFFKSWFYIVAKNHCLMELRRKNIVILSENGWKNISADDMESEVEMHLYPDGEVDKETKLQLMEEGLKQLNDEQRKCIKLFYLENKCYDEISIITGYELKQVKSYIQNGKRNLKNYIESRNE